MAKSATVSGRERLWLALLLGLLILVLLPRFNRWDLGLALTPRGRSATEVVGDAEQYVALSRYFSEGAGEVDLRPPFAYRPLVPFLASILPIDPMTAINILNLAALAIAMLFLFKVLLHLALAPFFRILGCALFVIAFPTFYYGAIGIVDPVLISLLTIGTYFILTDDLVPLMIVLGLGALVKETIVLLLPVLVTQCLVREVRRARIVSITMVAVAIIAAMQLAARTLAPVAQSTVGWIPSSDTLLSNLSRARSLLSFVLSLGIPGFVALYYLVKSRGRINRELYPLLAGFAACFILTGYAFFSAYADGRFIWTSYPFAIPLAMVALEEIYIRRQTNRVM